MLGGFPSYISAQQHRVFLTMLLSEEQVLSSVQTWRDGSPPPSGTALPISSQWLMIEELWILGHFYSHLPLC